MDKIDKPKIMLRYLMYVLDFEASISYFKISKNSRENMVERIVNTMEKLA